MAEDAVIWNVVSGVAGALIVAVGTWAGKLVERSTKEVETAPDIQAVLSTAIADVVAHYKGALDRADGEAVALRAEVADLRRLVEAQSAKIDEQSAEIDGMSEHIRRLEASIVALGGNPPRRRPRQAKPAEEDLA